jgi:hypothetical protein
VFVFGEKDASPPATKNLVLGIDFDATYLDAIPAGKDTQKTLLDVAGRGGREGPTPMHSDRGFRSPNKNLSIERGLTNLFFQPR